MFQPTSSGKRESALYGSARTSNRGGHLRAIFHEGIDIAPVSHSANGLPNDSIQCVATGRVAYINAIAGNSTYGKYVVVEHDDPIGPVYTLYAHLASVDVTRGEVVSAGSTLGRMGNTATYAIPMSRAHLHFEVGVLLNSRFEQWYNGKKLTPSHDQYHGWNILGTNPLDFFKCRQSNANMSYGDVLKQTPIAFELIIRTNHLPDYFKRYALLWHGSKKIKNGITLAFSEGGVPLSGRVSTPDENAKLKKGQHAAVLKVDADVLGRNGTRLIAGQNENWSLAPSGTRRLEQLLF